MFTITITQGGCAPNILCGKKKPLTLDHISTSTSPVIPCKTAPCDLVMCHKAFLLKIYSPFPISSYSLYDERRSSSWHPLGLPGTSPSRRANVLGFSTSSGRSTSSGAYVRILHLKLIVRSMIMKNIISKQNFLGRGQFASDRFFT